MKSSFMWYSDLYINLSLHLGPSFLIKYAILKNDLFVTDYMYLLDKNILVCFINILIWGHLQYLHDLLL